jgi:hypothetical protein
MWERAARAASQEGSMGSIPDANRQNGAEAPKKQTLFSRNCQWLKARNRGLLMEVHTDTKQRGPLAGMSESSIGTPQPAWQAGTAETGWSKVSPTTRVLEARTRYSAPFTHSEISTPQ